MIRKIIASYSNGVNQSITDASMLLRTTQCRLGFGLRNMDTLARRQQYLDQFVGMPLRYGGWAISEDILFDILQYCLLETPKTILDLGSGSTTVVLAKYAEKMSQNGKEVSIISVDSDADWLQNTRRLLELNNVSEYVDLTHAPISETDYGLYYNPTPISEALHAKKLDLVIVDGPPGPTQIEARYPLVPLFKEHFKDSTVIFLDDGDRQDETVIAEKWSNELNEWVSNYRPYQKGGHILHHPRNKTASLIGNHPFSTRFEIELTTASDTIKHMQQQVDALEQTISSLESKMTGIEKSQESIISQRETETQQNLSLLEQKNSQLQKAIHEIQQSTSFKIGNTFVRAARSPWTLISKALKSK